MNRWEELTLAVPHGESINKLTGDFGRAQGRVNCVARRSISKIKGSQHHSRIRRLL